MSGFYLGKHIKVNRFTDEKFYLSPDDFLRHAFICGSTGAGKTVLGKILIEEAARNGIPSIVIDLKGDLSSMAIPFVNLVPEEVLPWISPGKAAEEKLDEARDYISSFKARLKQFSISQENIREFRQKADFRVYTPRTRKGQKFSISELYSPPEDIERLIETEPEIVAGMIQNMAISIMGRVLPGSDPKEMMVELSFLEEIIRSLWLSGQELEGIRGLEVLIDTIKSPPFEMIGRLTLDEFIEPQVRMEFVKKLNSLILGSQRCWFEGRSIASVIRELVTSGDTRVAIFNLTELDSHSDRSLVVSQLAYSIYNAYRRAHSEHLKLLFYIDEVGGAGSNSFFPPEPYFNLAKPALNLVLRQGRAFGVGMILATQNPGDIDYKGLTNCHCWFIGKLLTEEDRKKALEGISRAEIKIERAAEYIRDAGDGSFLVKTRAGKVFQFQERWLFSMHKILGDEELDTLREEMERKKEYLDACQTLEGGDVSEAVAKFTELIRKHPGEPGNYFDLAAALAASGDPEKAVRVMDSAEKAGITGEQLFYRKGVILEQVDHERAKLCFFKALELNPLMERAHYQLAGIFSFHWELEQALLHISEACKNNYLQEDFWFRKAEILARCESWYEALAALENSIKVVPDSEKFNIFKLFLLIRSGRINEAEKQAVPLKGNDPFLLFCRALLCRSRGEDDEYLRLLAVARENGAQCAPLLIANTEKLFASGDFASAADEVERALAIDPHNPDCWYLHARIMYETGQPLKALSDIDRALSSKKEHRYHFLAGEILKKKGEFSRAFDSYKAAIKMKHDHIPSYIRQAEIVIDREPKQALDIINRALEIKAVPEMHLLKSKSLFLQGYTREALVNMDEYMNHREADAGAWTLRAEILKKEGNWKGVYENFRSMLTKIGPKENYFLEAADALLRLRQFEEAIDVCDQAMEKFPESAAVWKKLATVYREMGEEEKAVFCEQKISALNSGPDPGVDSKA